MNRIVHQIRPVLGLLALMLFGLPPHSLQAQNRHVVSGIVKSDADETLPGVYILVKGSTLGTSTDADGKYSLEVPDDATLIFSFIGMKNMEVNVNNQTAINVVMQDDARQLDEVVVVGYGTQKKIDLTGAVASVPIADLKNVPITRADQMLQGRISGVQVTQNNAEPGGAISIRIRGTNSINSGNEPLFVIDGFPGAGNLNTINPNDIESIDVLKDASATAIYGSRGANGVVIITTKKGKMDQNNIYFEAYTGVQTIRHKYDMMNAQQFGTYLNEVQTRNNTENSTAIALPYPTQSDIDALGKGTDWQDQIFRSAPMQNYQLGFNGGNGGTKYNLSMNYFDQDGIVINSGFKRGSIRLNVDRKISEKLNFSFTSTLSRSHENKALVNTAGGSAGGVVLDALRASPTTPVWDENGYVFRNGPLPYAESQVGNPVAYANLSSDHRNVLRGLLNAAGEYQIVKGLKFKVLGGVDLNYGNNDSYVPSGLFFGGATTTGTASRTSSNNYSWVNENTLAYDKQVGEKHSINAVAGFSAQQFINQSFTTSAQNFFTDALGADNLSFGANLQTPTSSKSVNALASFFGRVNYKLSNKYLLTVTMRADGSSRFGPEKKWGYFPSGAFAWRIIEESFMKNIQSISDLKLRVGYGVVGNQEIGNYQSMARYQSFAAHGQRTDYLSGPTRLVGLAKANIANKDLGWESTESFNFGVDAGFLNNRLTVTADYYIKTTKDLLLFVSIPQTSGFQNIYLNAGSVGNRGLEIAVNTINVDEGKFRWTSNFNFSRNRNKVLDLAGETQRFVGSSSSSLFPGGGGTTAVLQVGQPIGTFYGLKGNGIYQTPEEVAADGFTSPVTFRPGDPRYVDQNGDKIINASDRVIIGHAQPKFIFGFTNTVNFGPLSLSVLLQGVQGTNVLNLNRYEIESGITTTNKLKSVENRWTGEGTSNTIPKANSTVRRTVGISDNVIEDASFIRVKTISLGYDLPIPKSIGHAVKSANIYVTAQNLFTFTKYTGYDPEVNSYDASATNNLNLNTDYNSFPTSKTIIAGIKLAF